MKLHHIAIKTNDLDKSLEFYKKLGFKFKKILEDTIEQLIYELEKDSTRLELIYSFIYDEKEYSDEFFTGFGHLCFIVNEKEYFQYKEIFKNGKEGDNNIVKVYKIKGPSGEEIHFNYKKS